MNKILIALLIITVSVYTKPVERHTTKYDGLEVNQIVKNKHLLEGYYKCLADLGPCSPDGKSLKAVLPNAIHSRCSKCNEKQKVGAYKIIGHLIKHEKGWWANLQRKYDPDGRHVQSFKEEISKQGGDI